MSNFVRLEKYDNTNKYEHMDTCMQYLTPLEIQNQHDPGAMVSTCCANPHDLQLNP